MQENPSVAARRAFYAHPWTQRLKDPSLDQTARLELIQLIMAEVLFHQKSGLEDHFEQKFPPGTFE